MTSPLPIPELSADEAARQSRMFGQSRRIIASIGSRPATISLVRPNRNLQGLFVRLLAGDVSLWVTFSDWPALLSGSPAAEGVDLATLPPEIAAAVLESAAEPVLAALSNAAEVPWKVLEVRTAGQPPYPWRVGLEVAIEPGPVMSGLVATDDAGMELVERLVSLATAQTHTQLADVPFTAPLEMGMTSLPVEDLRRLKRHDVVLLDVTAFLPNRHAVFRTSATSAWRVTIDGDNVTLVEPRQTTPPPALPRDTPTVNVLFEYGQVSIPAGAIASLTAGQQLSRSAGDAVQLCVDGIPFASAELIQIGSRLGARILELGAAPRA